jgi:hypothetical protein
LQPVGVLTITGIIRADGWFHIGNIPGFWSEYAQEGSRVVSSRANLRVIRLPDKATATRPKLLKIDDDILEIRRLKHENSDREGLDAKLYHPEESHHFNKNIALDT